MFLLFLIFIFNTTFAALKQNNKLNQIVKDEMNCVGVQYKFLNFLNYYTTPINPCDTIKYSENLRNLNKDIQEEIVASDCDLNVLQNKLKLISSLQDYISRIVSDAENNNIGDEIEIVQIKPLRSLIDDQPFCLKCNNKIISQLDEFRTFIYVIKLKTYEVIENISKNKHITLNDLLILLYEIEAVQAIINEVVLLKENHEPTHVEDITIVAREPAYSKNSEIINMRLPSEIMFDTKKEQEGKEQEAIHEAKEQATCQQLINFLHYSRNYKKNTQKAQLNLFSTKRFTRISNWIAIFILTCVVIYMAFMIYIVYKTEGIDKILQEFPCAQKLQDSEEVKDFEKILSVCGNEIDLNGCDSNKIALFKNFISNIKIPGC